MALRPTIINKFGKIMGWGNITTTIGLRQVEGITAISYSDSKEFENVYGAGGYPIGEGEGNYAAKASVTLLKEEQIGLLDSLPAGQGLTEIEPFDITVTYKYNNRIYTDVIRNCRFMGAGTDGNQNDKSLAYQYSIKCSHIDWNV